jgi:DNA helicase II / ATP-dependent DNA helicase PcrA
MKKTKLHNSFDNPNNFNKNLPMLRSNLKEFYELEFITAYNNLNPNQKQVVDTIDGPVLVIAGPGSGKTQILTLRVANILKLTDTLPQSILCLTFTTLATSNMRERLSKFVGMEADKVKISTYHSFALELINRYPHKFVDQNGFKQIDEYQKLEVLRTVLKATKKINPDNQLTKFTKEQGHVYQTSIFSRISDLKRAGISSQELKTLLEQNLIEFKYLVPHLQVLQTSRVDKSLVEQIPTIVNNIQKDAQASFFNQPLLKLGETRSLTKQIIIDLLQIYQNYQNKKTDEKKGLTKLLTEYKKKLFNASGELKDYQKTLKLLDFCEIYEQYQTNITKNGLVDYDDMINMVYKALENDQEFKLEVASLYQYILVDEFQDTSNSQLRLISCLIDLDINSQSPNILAVGDDDQSIYKFQGARIQNITDFVNYFNCPPTIITLNTNYRSASAIVDLSNQYIKVTDNRFADLYKLNKEIVASKASQTKAVSYEVYNNQTEEVIGVGQKIKNLIKDGLEPKDIAVIVSKHKSFSTIVNYLTSINIPITYERGQNVLDKAHILEIISLLELVCNITVNPNSVLVNQNIATVLSSDYWQIDELLLYQLAKTSSQNRLSWIDNMINAEALGLWTEFTTIAKYFLALGKMSTTVSAERLIDTLIGQPNEVDQSNHEQFQKPKDWIKEYSPYAKFYFSYDQLNIEYLELLSSLRTLIQKVRSYQNSRFIKAQDLLVFFRFHQEESLRIIDNNIFNQEANAVNLLTVHKAKGLEFDQVFMPFLTKKDWQSKKPDYKLTFTSNLPFSIEADDNNDFARLVYVALTRGKNFLHLSTYFKDADAQQIDSIDILKLLEEPTKIEVDRNQLASLVAIDTFDRSISLRRDTKEFIKELLVDYQLSTTHLWNFIDLVDKGPKYFLHNNLLRFPCAKSEFASYGTAIHKALFYYYCTAKKNKEQISKDYLIEVFRNELDNQNLDQETYPGFLLKGTKCLTNYYQDQALEEHFDVEYGFANEVIKVGNARITGNIDKLVYLGQNQEFIHVVDYKTGNAFSSFGSIDQNTISKVNNYKTQLLFYKLLIEQSVNFKGKTVASLAVDFLDDEKTFDKKEHYKSYNYQPQDYEDLKLLIVAVYNRIIEANFEVPQVVLAVPEKDRNRTWKEYLINEGRKIDQKRVLAHT